MASRPYQFWERKRSKIRKRAAKYFEGLAALSIHSAERRVGAFIYALSADETSPALAASRHAITALFSCRFKCLALPGGNGIFAATPAERITHYTLQAKSCARGQAPLETPDNKTGGMLPSLGAYRRLLSAARFTVCFRPL